MVDAVRRRVTWTQRGRRGRKADVEWINRRRLLRGFERLTDEQRTTLFAKLLSADPNQDIAAAWIAKEPLREPLSCADRGGLRYADHYRPGPLLPILRGLHSARSDPAGPHHRDLAGTHHRRPADRLVQRPHRELQPHRQACRTHRLRLPPPAEPTPPSTVGLHSPITTSHIQPTPKPLPTAKSRIDDLDLVRSGGMKTLFDAVYAPSTIGTLLREFTFGHARQPRIGSTRASGLAV